MSLAGLVEGVARSASGEGLPVADKADAAGWRFGDGHAASAAGSVDREVMAVIGVRRCFGLGRGRRGCLGACGGARAAPEGGAAGLVAHRPVEVGGRGCT